ncbi:acyl-CoA dehydrogenase [Saccharobesus litoralis]|uniref:Acyl-coenzyme A dehydrogenase n=1 Tax=Saccharobesus litoralis TaxID=2172099 RepID=A0A2S0VT15_9ALTE|nr:acyl-CoA dehydrogenase [Saccharobesus litoralis]AWB67347.1 acyl-CoA dehydrogenase [Saccharobesus litoralis]
MIILLLTFAVIATVLLVADVRRQLITRPIFSVFKKILPPLSTTEREAMEAGDIWWDGELFRGKPDWQKLHAYQDATLSADEQQFMDTQLETLMAMLDDYKICHETKNLPEPVWDYLKSNGFFAMIIPKQYGGLEFSSAANSHVVTRIATRSLSAAVTVMVPNSLGPGELLMHYGTQEQKDFWLPNLSNGKDIPCFALTGPEAGSDAGAIPDKGIVCKGEYEGKEVLGISLTWNKRYITLAPVATVLGLAFKLQDPDGLLGDKEDIGITCALIPTSHPGVNIGDRHNPMGLAFMNGTTSGENVFIPLEWIIGGADYAGKGWRMLVECLSAGRGISLPALATAIGHVSVRMTSAYSYVRKQFGLSIGRFEGVQESLARIGGLAYTLEAARKFTISSLDMGYSPSVVTAISKYHMTEMGRQVINDAMDIHSGKAIQMGPNNYLANLYAGVPIAITVEGANILTRNLMIFGQGATRCHPYVFKEMEAAANPDQAAGLLDFDSLLVKHVKFAVGNFAGCLGYGLTGGRFIDSPVAGETANYYKQLTRLSRALALCTDISLLVLGGALKRKEMISARLGDVLSQLYLASAVLKRYETDGRQLTDLPYVHYSVQLALHKAGVAFEGYFQNFRPRWLTNILHRVIFPLGNPYKMPNDRLARSLCKNMLKPGESRDRVSYLCYLGTSEDDATGVVEAAFHAMVECREIEVKLTSAQKSGVIPRRIPLDEAIMIALDKGVLSEHEAKQITHADELRKKAIAVDSFKFEELGHGAQHNEEKASAA